MDKNTWQKIRHRSTKGANVGKALVDWKAHCPDDFHVKEGVFDADLCEDVALNLSKALTTASKNLADPSSLLLGPDKKSARATATLIEEWQAEVKRYLAKIKVFRAGLTTRRGKADAYIKKGVAPIETAIQELAQLVAESNEIKAGVSRVESHLKRDPDERALEELREELAATVERAKQIGAKAKQLGTALKNDSSVVAFRGLGGLGIVQKFALTKKDVTTYSKVFADVTKKFDSVNTAQRKLIARVDKQALAVGTILAQADDTLDDVGKAVKIAEVYKTAMDARVAKVRLLIKQADERMMALSVDALAKMPPDRRKDQKHATEMQIRQVIERRKAFVAAMKQLGSMRKRTESAIGTLIDHADVAPTMAKANAALDALDAELGDWWKRHEAAAKHAAEYLKQGWSNASEL